MKKYILSFFIPVCVLLTPLAVFADVSGLTPCKDSAVFKRRLDQSVKKLSGRLANYEEATPAYLALQKQIDATNIRFNKYADQGLLCGADGLPHLITDGRWDHAGEFILPGIAFLYISGWIGWVGRTYLQFTKTTEKPNESEIIINVPVAIGIVSSGFLWPVKAWNELVSGELLVPGNEITVSPR